MGLAEMAAWKEEEKAIADAVAAFTAKPGGYGLTVSAKKDSFTVSPKYTAYYANAAIGGIADVCEMSPDHAAYMKDNVTALEMRYKGDGFRYEDSFALEGKTLVYTTNLNTGSDAVMRSELKAWLLKKL